MHRRLSCNAILIARRYSKGGKGKVDRFAVALETDRRTPYPHS